MVKAASAAKQRQLQIVRYGIFLTDLNPTLGAELAKIRPVVVVSHDSMNRALETVVVCPLTTVLRPTWRSRVACVCSGRAAEIAVDQIRTTTKARFVKSLGKLEAQAAAQVRDLIAEMYSTE
jgi:mRNA interferase MazF